MSSLALVNQKLVNQKLDNILLIQSDDHKMEGEKKNKITSSNLQSSY